MARRGRLGVACGPGWSLRVGHDISNTAGPGGLHGHICQPCQMQAVVGARRKHGANVFKRYARTAAFTRVEGWPAPYSTFRLGSQMAVQKIRFNCGNTQIALFERESAADRFRLGRICPARNPSRGLESAHSRRRLQKRFVRRRIDSAAIRFTATSPCGSDSFFSMLASSGVKTIAS